MRYAKEHQHHHCNPHDRHRGGGFGRGGEFGPGFGGPGGPGGDRFFGPGFGGPGGFGGRGRGPGGRGPGGPGGPGGRRRRGDVRLGLLLLLKENPANGYQLIQGLSEKTEGMWTPSPGSVYPTLSQLEDEGLIAGVQKEGESGTTYGLTTQGKEYLDGLGEVKAPWDDVPNQDHPAFQFRRSIGGIFKAAGQIYQDGDADKIAKAQEILTQTRKDLYRILADDEA